MRETKINRCINYKNLWLMEGSYYLCWGNETVFTLKTILLCMSVYIHMYKITALYNYNFTVGISCKYMGSLIP